MQNQILTDETTVYYVVRVNGRDVSVPFATQMLAEMEKQNLSPELQTIAEIVPITSEGKQLLLG